jgi:hypothetical protein
MSGPLAFPGRNSAARLIVGAVVLAGVLAIAGCSAKTSSTPTPEPSKTAAAAHATPTPTPTPTFAALNYTCNSILPPATLAVFKSKNSAGFTLQGDYLQRMQNIASPLVAFDTYGGILCQWSYSDSSESVNYAFSPITSANAASQQSALRAIGYTGTAKDHGTLYANSDTSDYPDEYLFIDGYWLQASSDSVMQLLVDNVFVLPN